MWRETHQLSNDHCWSNSQAIITSVGAHYGSFLALSCNHSPINVCWPNVLWHSLVESYNVRLVTFFQASGRLIEQLCWPASLHITTWSLTTAGHLLHQITPCCPSSPHTTNTCSFSDAPHPNWPHALPLMPLCFRHWWSQIIATVIMGWAHLSMAANPHAGHILFRCTRVRSSLSTLECQTVLVYQSGNSFKNVICYCRAIMNIRFHVII